jgi:hypothetical protein
MKLLSDLDTIHIVDAIKKYHNTNNDIFDAFSMTQFISKYWLITNLINYLDMNRTYIIYIFGGWYGFLPYLFYKTPIAIHKIYNIDVNKDCQEISNYLNIKQKQKYFFYNMDMSDWWAYESNSIVINTSCEHIDDATYKKWYDKISNDSLIVLQSNDLFRIKEHIRCSNSLEHFVEQSLLTNILWKGETFVDQHKEYKRFMIIGKK